MSKTVVFNTSSTQDLLRHYYDDHYLGIHALRNEPIINNVLLNGDKDIPFPCSALVLRQLIDWGLDTLRQKPYKISDAYYEILHLRYIERATFVDIYKIHGIKKPTAKARQRRAIEELSRILNVEAATLTYAVKRKHYYLKTRCNKFPPPLAKNKLYSDDIYTRLLEAVSLLRYPVSVAFLKDLGNQWIRVRDINHVVKLLHDQNLLRSDSESEQTSYYIHPEIKIFLTEQINLADKQRAHAIIAGLYKSRNHYIEVIYHRMATNERTGFELALKLLKQEEFTGATSIIPPIGTEILPTQELQEVLLNFQNKTPTAQEQAYISLLLGIIAEWTQPREHAQQYYDTAYSLGDDTVKAYALFRLSRLSQQGSSYQSYIRYYQQCEAHLSNKEKNIAHREHLLVRLFISHAWYLLDQRDDKLLKDVRYFLDKANAMIQTLPSDMVLKAEWHNGMGLYCVRSRKKEMGFNHFRQAEMFARGADVHDVERLINIHYNLGNAYTTDFQEYALANSQFQYGLMLSKSSGNTLREHFIYKGMGENFYFQGDYEKAKGYYTLFHNYSKDNKIDFWIVVSSYDLAECCYKLQEIESWDYLCQCDKMGRDSANSLALELTVNLREHDVYGLFTALDNLRDREGTVSLLVRQILQLAWREDSIKNKMIQEVYGYDNKQRNQISKMLTKLVELGTLKKGEKKGYYFLAAKSAVK